MHLRLGVVAVQGDVAEHVAALEAALRARGLDGDVLSVRDPEDLADVDGVVLPGGESTTIGRLLKSLGLHEVLRRRAEAEDLPVLGTCAGLILLASEGGAQVERTGTELLGLLDMAADRNAFGRQRESFEAPVHVEGEEEPFQAVFIRAPAVVRTWGACHVLATLPPDVVARATGAPAPDHPVVVAVTEGNRMALAFHPELTPDTRLHERFLDLVVAWRNKRDEGGASDPQV